MTNDWIVNINYHHSTLICVGLFGNEMLTGLQLGK